MDNLKKDFKKFLAQTSDFLPFQIEVDFAEGIYLFDTKGKKYINLMSGIAVSNLGHRHPAVLKAIREQMDAYLHVMVYGEFVESPQVRLAKKLSDILPSGLNKSFFVNSGSEAIEGALKLARKYTQRTEIIAFRDGYHGSTMGALSLLADRKFKEPFLPLMPEVRILNFNNLGNLDIISEKTACVITEVVQAGSGIHAARHEFLNKLKEKCNEKGALLIFDEIQTCYGRTGEMFAFENYGIVPDILCIAKSMGGELPLGAFISSKKIMDSFGSEHPLLGHATTFGGHPLSCAASIAVLDVIEKEKLLIKTKNQSEDIRKRLENLPNIKEVRGLGKYFAFELEQPDKIEKVVENCIENGIITYWFLFNHNSLSFIPPLTINDEQLEIVFQNLKKSLEI